MKIKEDSMTTKVECQEGGILGIKKILLTNSRMIFTETKAESIIRLTLQVQIGKREARILIKR